MQNSLMRITLALLFGVVFMNVQPALADWIVLEPGLEQTKISEAGYEMSVIRISPAKFNIQVLDSIGYLRDKLKYPQYCIDEIVDSLRPVAVINGGFSSSFSAPFPAGLLFTNGKTISRMNGKSTVQTGVFFVSAGIPGIATRDNFSLTNCNYALQSGPLLVEDTGKVCVGAEQRKFPKYRRSVIAKDENSNILLITTSETNLYDLALSLAGKGTQKTIKCFSALNLSGAEESAVFLQSRGAKFIDGNTSSSISSAIVFTRKW